MKIIAHKLLNGNSWWPQRSEDGILLDTKTYNDSVQNEISPTKFAGSKESETFSRKHSDVREQ